MALSRPVLAALAIAALGGAGLGGYLYTATGTPETACGQSRVAGATIGGPFTLVDETGRTVTDRDVITKPSLVYFGYTFCPDVCPTDSARNAEALELIQARGIDAQAEFTDIFHPDMIGLTGTPEQVAAASKAYRTFYAKQDTGDEYYLMDHSTFTYLVLPERGFVDFFRRDTTPEQIADTVACFAASG
jgi:protein SCO1/2